MPGKLPSGSSLHSLTFVTEVTGMSSVALVTRGSSPHTCLSYLGRGRDSELTLSQLSYLGALPWYTPDLPTPKLEEEG